MYSTQIFELEHLQNDQMWIKSDFLNSFSKANANNTDDYI